MKNDSFSKRPSGSRPLKVGEEIRHALSDIFLRGELYDPELQGVSITVSEVRVSPDLKNATAYVMPLAGANKEEILDALNRAAPGIRYLVSEKVELRYMPRLNFKLDTSYEEAGKINALLHDVRGKGDENT